MSISDLVFDIKGGDLNLEELLPITEVKSEDDKKKYYEKGYNPILTLSEFKSLFPKSDEGLIFYQRSSFIPRTIIYDKKRYIYREIAISQDGILGFNDEDKTNEEKLNRFINAMERTYKSKNYSLLLHSFPDAVRFQVFFQMLKDKYITEEIYETFISIYTSSEYGFMNISLDALKEMVSYQSKEYKDNFLSKLKDLEEEVIIYRGEGDRSSDYKNGACSWTLDINIANFFATRYARDNAKIIKAKVKKSSIIDYLEGRGEKEVLVFPENIEVLETINCYTINDLKEKYLYDYALFDNYKDVLRELSFNKIDGHDKNHSLRVLFLALIIGYELDLTDEDAELLAIACINHDRGRKHDRKCTNHGKESFKIFSEEGFLEDVYTEYFIDENEVEFLLTYHCKDDKEAEEFSNKNFVEEGKDRLLKLLYILKDADALDRVRFGIKDLDMNYLRFDISKKLTLLANLCLKGLKL